MKLNGCTGYGNTGNQKYRAFNMTAFLNDKKVTTEVPSSDPLRFEDQYCRLRGKEGRLLSHREVAELPKVSSSHPYRKEWVVRAASCKRLVLWFSQKRRPLRILEIGCGNGWLAHQLSLVKDSTVVGLDVNIRELEQAGVVFGDQANLRFFHGELSAFALGGSRFDAIVFAAAIQYFSPLKDILSLALTQLDPGGEIHILDSPFYLNPGEAESARERSRIYFSSMGQNGMEAFYFHHTLSDLAVFHPVILAKPSNAFHRIFGRPRPFYWICITAS